MSAVTPLSAIFQSSAGPAYPISSGHRGAEPNSVTPPKLSVVTLVYNQAPYLLERIRSIRTQTFQDFEWIVIDDCSTDGSAGVLRTELEDIPQVRRLIVHSENAGVHRSYNEALSFCTGEYVARAEGDDSSAPGFFAEAVTFLDQHASAAFVHSAYRVIDANGDVLRVICDNQEDRVESGQEVFRRLALQGNFICSPSVVFRRPLYDAVRGMRDSWVYAGDYELWLKLSLKGDVGYMARPLIDWRRLAQGISNRGSISPSGVAERYGVLDSVFSDFSSAHDQWEQLRKMAIRGVSTHTVAPLAIWWLCYRRDPASALALLREADRHDPGVWLNPKSYLAVTRFLLPRVARRLLTRTGGAIDSLPRHPGLPRERTG